MPAYLCHGFRWHRKSIRYFVILQDIEDAAPEWIVAPKSAEAVLETFYDLYDFIPPCAESRAAISLNTYNVPPGGAKADIHKINIELGSDEERRGRREEETTLKHKKSLSHSRSRSKSKVRLKKSSKKPENLAVPMRPTQAPPPLYSPMPPKPQRCGLFNQWSSVKMVEEFDPAADESALNGPWAYLSDYAIRIDSSVSPIEEMKHYEEHMKSEKFKAMSGTSDESGRKIETAGNKNAGWLEKLRDQLEKDEPIKWYVVICGDEERSFPPAVKVDDALEPKIQEDSMEDDFEYRLPEFDTYKYARKSAVIPPLRLKKPEQDDSTPPPTPRLFEQFQNRFPMMGRSKSHSQLRTQPPAELQPPPMPLPSNPPTGKLPPIPSRNTPEHTLRPSSSQMFHIPNNRTSVLGRAKSQSQLIPPRPQTQPQPEIPPLRQPSVEKLPALPTVSFPDHSTPPPDPLANLRDMGSRKSSAQSDMKPIIRKSTLGLRKLFSSKKKIENFG